jgi:N-acetyl-anhydromuramyl-L-alanine amidase AmpD
MLSRCPFAKWIPADPSNYRKGRKAHVSLVVIHITSGHAHALPVAQMWQGTGHKSSAHFVIDQDGSIIQAIDTEDTAWHASNANSYAVGIEHCAREPNEPAFPKGDPGLPVSDAIYASSAKLCAWLLKQYKLQPNRDHVKGHCEVDTVTSHTGCPNSIWDWDRYMVMVQAEYAKL